MTDTAAPAGALHLFQGFGIEMEYMIVERQTLDVLPVSDRILEAQAGAIVDEVEVGPLCWSNELVLHVIELKTNGPAKKLPGAAANFQEHVRRINAILEPMNGCLMPSAMHPWMDPHRETRLWPHENSPIYNAYNRIFDCRGHGWSNLQSTHLNLPFADDAEFGKLHAAIRLVLPILPALSASSPAKDGRLTGLLDSRLDVYRSNQKSVPIVAGQVVPEPVFTRADYDREIFQRIFDAIRPHDPHGILQFEWLNSRGAIARFMRYAIEIRVLDIQECPAADLAVLTSIIGVLRALVDETWSPTTAQQTAATDALANLLWRVVRDGEHTEIADAAYLANFGISDGPLTAGELWKRLVKQTWPGTGVMEAEVEAARDVILHEGPLARRLLAALGAEPSRADFARVYRRLCECLHAGEPFRAA